MAVKYRFYFKAPTENVKSFLSNCVDIRGRKYWKAPVMGKQSRKQNSAFIKAFHITPVT